MARNVSQKLVLTPDNIKQENNKFEKLKKITFKSGGYTEIYTFFKPQKIQEMIRDFSEFLVAYEKQKGRVDDTEEFYLFFMLHVCKHFSTICPEFPKDIAEKISFIKHLAEHPCMFELKDSFNPKEVAKIFDQMYKQLEDYQKLMKQDAELRRKFIDKIDKLEHGDIIKKVMLNMGDDDGNTEMDAGARTETAT